MQCVVRHIANYTLSLVGFCLLSKIRKRLIWESKISTYKVWCWANTYFLILSDLLSGISVLGFNEIQSNVLNKWLRKSCITENDQCCSRYSNVLSKSWSASGDQMIDLADAIDSLVLVNYFLVRDSFTFFYRLLCLLDGFLLLFT